MGGGKWPVDPAAVGRVVGEGGGTFVAMDKLSNACWLSNRTWMLAPRMVHRVRESGLGAPIWTSRPRMSPEAQTSMDLPSLKWWMTWPTDMTLFMVGGNPRYSAR